MTEGHGFQVSQDSPMPQPSALRRIGRRLFGAGPLLRLPGARSWDGRLRSAVTVSVVFHGALFVGGSLMTASGLLRSGGSVAGVEIVLDTQGLATGPMPDRDYAPQPERVERAPEAQVPDEERLPADEPPPELAEPPQQLAALTEPETLQPERLEAPPAALPLQQATEPEAAIPAEIGEPEPLIGVKPDALPQQPPPEVEPELPVEVDPVTPPMPPTLADAPDAPDAPAEAPVAPEPPVETPPLLAEAPVPELALPPEPAAPQVSVPDQPEPPPTVLPEPPIATVTEPDPDPVVPEEPETVVAALQPPPALPDVPVVPEFEEADQPQAQPDPPPAPEAAAEPEPPAPDALALPPDPPAPEQREPDPETAVGPVAWDAPFQPPRADPRIIDGLTASALQSGRADGLDAEISAILSEISCGTLNASLGANGEVAVRGFMTSSTEQEGLRDRLLALGDVTGVDDEDVLVVGSELCDGLAVYAEGTAVLAPNDDRSVPRDLRELLDPLFGTVQGARERFVGSNYLDIYVRTPDYPAHVYIDYFKPGGTVVHLTPSEHSPDAYYPDPHSTIPISEHDGGLAVPAGPPYGTGMVVTLSASAPLFQPGSMRPREEIAADYLRDLDVALREREIDPDFRSQYGYVFVEALREGDPLRQSEPIRAAEETGVIDSPELY
jgi:hypothetical protein